MSTKTSSLEKAHEEIERLRESRGRLEREVSFLRERMGVHEEVLSSRDMRWARTLGALIAHAEARALAMLLAVRKAARR